MKKIIVLLIAVTSFTVSFAQQGYNRNQKNNHNQPGYENRKPNDQYSQNYSKDYGYKDFDHNYNDRNYNQRNQQADIDRVNRDYDRRIYTYRNDHSINRYQRDRMIRQAEMERSQKISSFAGGVINHFSDAIYSTIDTQVRVWAFSRTKRSSASRISMHQAVRSHQTT